MKMKEVTEKTGLTDRAVRLYIDEGLAVPNIEESYSGRKSIDFSESDVERLKNVALLRKAGFSIADIKSMVDDNSTAKNIIEKFIEQTENNIAHETEIVEKLKGISFDEDVTLETICKSLSATVEEKDIPKEDLKYKEAKRTAKQISGIFIIATILSFIFSALYLNSCYEHLFFEKDFFWLFLISFSGWIIILLCAISVFIIYAVKAKTEKAKKIQDKLSNAAALVIWCLFVPSILFSLIGSIMLMPLAIHSQTNNPKNYLVFDDVVESFCDKEITALFPREIPVFSDSEKPIDINYFYSYADYPLGFSFDIIAEWSLSKRNYEEAKNNAPLSIGENKAVSVKKGDWICTYYADSNEVHIPDQGGYYFVNFAYNDELQKVRYIISYDDYTYPEDAEIYNSIKWN